MAYKVYAGVSGKAKNVTTLYCGDANGKARRIIKGYQGDENGKARLVYLLNVSEWLYPVITDTQAEVRQVHTVDVSAGEAVLDND